MTDDPGGVERRTTQRVSSTAQLMSANLADLTGSLHGVLAAEIGELQGDQAILDLLAASIESNLETLVQVLRYDIAMTEVRAPAAAEEYARRLAQRGISANALVRAYRLGQENALVWCLDQIAEQEPDPRIAYAAAQAFLKLTFRYIDTVSEQVVRVYEAERERWLANRNTVRAATLTELLRGEAKDVAGAEAALGYRLRQHHLGVVLWQRDPRAASNDLGELEALLTQVARAVGGTGQPLFIPRDRSMGWGWIPLGRNSQPGSAAAVTELGAHGIHLALGVVGSGPAGFRSTHLDALQAQSVAMAAADHALPVTSYAEPGVRAAALLAGDLESTRRLVRTTLGGLAADTEAAARLRETLLVFLSTRNSFSATAALIHLHKNTVKYRVDKALEVRGKPIEVDRLDLELALQACQWLGGTVLDTGATD